METGEILIVKLSAIGDVVHTLPSLEALYRVYPHSKITWLVEEEASPIIQDHHCLTRVIVSKRKRWLKQLRRPALWIPTIKEVFRFVRELRSVKYGLIIDFQGLLKSGLLVFLCRGKRKVGYDKAKELSYLFLSERYPPGFAEQHALEKNLNLVKYSCGSSFEGDFTYGEKRGGNIVANQKEKQAINGFLKEHEINEGKPLIAIHAMARWKTKEWDNQKFARISDQLIEDYNAQIIFTGQKQDTPVVNGIIAQMNRHAINASGQTTLKELAYLFQRAQLVITTDSGPMHIAAAVGTPTVALFGPTAPWRTGPYSKSSEIIRTNVHCSPCFKKKCNHISCMKDIRIETVLAAVDALLLKENQSGGLSH